MPDISTAPQTLEWGYRLLELAQRLGVEESGRATTTDLSTNLKRLLFGGIFYNAIYHPRILDLQISAVRNVRGRYDVKDLKKATDQKPWLAGTVECSGIFMAGSLLNMGWWDRKESAPIFSLSNLTSWGRKDPKPTENVEPDWRGLKDVQSWLYNGFHLWAPSWDVNRWDRGDADPFLFGQLGRLDEADSLPVIVVDANKAKVCREVLTDIARKKGCLVAEVTLRGKLLSVAELKRFKGDIKVKRFIEKLIERGAIRKSCLIVDKDFSDKSDQRDRIDFHERPSGEPYSGYIWKCVCPNEYKDRPDPLLYSYFVWEHTNLASRDAINYNLDAMNHKISYIASQHGQSKDDFALLQQMMPEDRLRGEPGSAYDKPTISVDEFRRLFEEFGHDHSLRG
jgi:hypothetical protein